MPPSNLHVRVPASAARLTQSIEPVRVLLRAHKIDDRTARDILFCVHESCANAIKHGGSDEDVDVRLSLAEGVVHLFIADRGSGLDLNSYDPHRQPSLAEPDGRGLFCDGLPDGRHRNQPGRRHRDTYGQAAASFRRVRPLRASRREGR